MRKYWASLGAAVVLATATVAPAFAAPVEISKANEEKKVFAERVDIGGYSLYVNSRGKGKATVVFDAGYGSWSDEWAPIQKRTAQFAQAVTYDRAGYGLSDLSPKQRVASVFAEELHTLLHHAKIKPPYVLVGHSIASYNLRLFAEKYPDEVAGVVIVDGSHEEQIEKLIYQLPPEMQEGFFAGFNETGGTVQDVMQSQLEVQAARDAFADIPLTVLSSKYHGLPEYYENIWLTLQADIASTSKYGKQIISENGGHYLHLTDPELVNSAIREMVENVEKTK